MAHTGSVRVRIDAAWLDALREDRIPAAPPPGFYTINQLRAPGMPLEGLCPSSARHTMAERVRAGKASCVTHGSKRAKAYGPPS